MFNPRMLIPRGVFALVGTVIGAAAASGANAPFIGAGATSFDPEIGIVNSGVVLDAQAVVSSDRKHVTLTMRPQLSSLLALRDFTFQQGTGLVGVPPVQTNGQAANAAAKAPQPKAQPVAAPPSILQRPGMTRIDNR